MTTQEKIQKLLTDQPWLTSLVDALVYAAAAKQASTANNGGLTEQLAFIASRGMTEESVLQYLEEVKDD